MPALAFRNRLGQLVDVVPIPASKAKSEFGSMVERVARGAAVAITRHDTPQAVMLSYPEFEALVASAAPTLGALEARFDELLERMQPTQARRGMAAAFDATPAELGRAAVKAAVTARRR